MIAYLGFIFIVLVLILYSNYIRRKGFEKLIIQRSVSKNKLQVGEELELYTVVENRKRVPVPFLNIRQGFPLEFTDNVGKHHNNIFFNIKGFERAKSKVKLKASKRGVYLLKDMKISLGDMLGFNIETKEMEDYKEIVVYPELKKFSSFEVINNNIQGDNIIKRWIFQDPLYIKGLREYNVEDRMKDIHWPSSLRQNRLMVKEYDFTSEKELVFILNAQGGVPFYSYVDVDSIEFGISLCLSMIKASIDSGVATGLWTNAYIAAFSGSFTNKIQPQNNSFKDILELAGRIALPPRTEFSVFLRENFQAFQRDRVYVLIASFLDEESLSLLVKLKNSGVNIKLMDISEAADLPDIKGIERLVVKAGDNHGAT